jgi:hypothetical protein
MRKVSPALCARRGKLSGQSSNAPKADAAAVMDYYLSGMCFGCRIEKTPRAPA